MSNQKEYPLQYVKGVGPRRAESLYKEGFKSPKDLLLYFPTSYIDRDSSFNLYEIEQLVKKRDYIFENDFDIIQNEFSIKRNYSIITKVIDKRELSLGRGRKLLTLIVTDTSQKTAKINFWSRADWFKKIYKLGQYLVVSGVPNYSSSQLEFNHPDIDIVDESDLENYKAGKILPKYKITQNLADSNISIKIIRSIINNLIDIELKKFSEFLPDYLIKENSLLSFQDAIKSLHFPNSIETLKQAQKRMKFNDIFLFLLKTRKTKEKFHFKAPKIIGQSKLSRKVYDNLPFKLTQDQKNVLKDIAGDIEKEMPMKRLLQGDVGSGKTIVALLSILMAVDKGYQALFIAPTQVLAEQHYINIKKLCSNLNIEITLLTGAIKSKIRKDILQKISEGKSNIIIGTHALFQSKLEYNSLAFIVIDEQHKFGVAQRSKLNELAGKSFNDEFITPHVLVMSATPIPRTLSMTLYADMDVSIIKQKPAGRSPIITSIAFDSNINVVYNFIIKEINNGRQAYIVFPLIEKSEKIDLKSAQESFDLLSSTVFQGIKTSLLHGKLKPEEKDQIMQEFASGSSKILFSTTVIEVGVDVSNANVMLIMNAERFGLSQLHQLRGRVGRGKYQSFCILATKDKYQFMIGRKKANQEEKINAILRLKTLESSNDGFEIAEQDLLLRGPGDMTTEKQSGLPNFQFLDLVKDFDLIKIVRTQVDKILNEDPELEQERHAILNHEIMNLIQNQENYFDIA